MGRFAQHTKPLVGHAAPKHSPATPQSRVVQQGNERIQVMDDGPIPEVELDQVRARDGGETAPAVDMEDLENQKQIGPPVERWIITKGGRVQTHVNGQRTLVNVGKEIDSLNFDIKLLRRQGIQMERSENSDVA